MFDDFLIKLKKININGKEYIEWYKDCTYGVFFSDIPNVGNKIINKKVMTKEEIKSAKKKPLFCRNSVDVILVDYEQEKEYKFKINEGYDYDGATINKLFWKCIGAKEDIRFKIAALLHDVLCENHCYVENNRYFADKIFERCLYVGDTCSFVRWLMFHCVDNYQKLRGGWR